MNNYVFKEVEAINFLSQFYDPKSKEQNLYFIKEFMNFINSKAVE